MPKNAKNKEEKNAIGRPTDFKDEYPEQAEKLCRLGATDKEMADLSMLFDYFDTFSNEWKAVDTEIEHRISKINFAFLQSKQK